MNFKEFPLSARAASVRAESLVNLNERVAQNHRVLSEGRDLDRLNGVLFFRSTAALIRSAARIFFRNAINLGLPVMICPDAAAALEAGCDAELSVASNIIRQGSATWTAQPLDGEVAAILACGGLVARTLQILTGRSASQHEVGNG
jgi:hypothetical protein